MRRLILLLSFLSLLAFVIGGSLYYQASYAAYRKTDYALAREELLRISDYVEQQVTARQRMTAASALTTGAADYLLSPTPSAQKALIDELRELRAALSVTTVYLLDAQGETVASSNAGKQRDFMGHNFGFRPYFKSAIAGRPAHQIAMGKISKVVGTYFSHPVRGLDASSGVAGVMVIKAPLEIPQFEELATVLTKRLNDSPESIIVVTSPGGHVLAADNGIWVDRKLPMKALQGNDNRTLNLDDEEYRVTSLELSSFPGWQLLRLSKTQYWKQLLSPLLVPTGLLYLLLLIALTIALVWLYRTAAREVRARELATLRLRRSRARYRRRSEHDALTGLYNRGRYDLDIGKEMQRSERYVRPLSMALLDLDFFKKINDCHGHDEGDRVLRLVARLLKNNLRETDSAYRVGGEEFIVILPETEPGAAEALISRLRAAVRGSAVFTKNGETLQITFSCAIVTYHTGESENSFYRRADELLYEVKANGRDHTLVSPLITDKFSVLQAED